MVRSATLLLLVAAVGFTSGCSPMKAPMPVRLDDENQARIDQGWEKAFETTDRLLRQDLLDALVVTQGYQIGVDRFTYRAEKRLKDGRTVVMAIEFDRARPEEDRFEVRVQNAAGVVVRSERYGRKDVEDTYRDLCTPPTSIRNETGVVIQTEPTTEQKARLARVESLFPPLKEDATAIDKP